MDQGQGAKDFAFGTTGVLLMIAAAAIVTIFFT
jgi:hypothetical protein